MLKIDTLLIEDFIADKYDDVLDLPSKAKAIAPLYFVSPDIVQRIIKMRPIPKFAIERMRSSST